MEAKEAYEVLTDDRKRAAYDQFGHAGLDSAAAGGRPGGGTADAFGDIFGDVFGDIFGGAGQRTRGGPQRGADLRYNLEIDLEDAVHGSTVKIRVPTLETCEECNGSGARRGSSPVNCTTCGGAGQIRMQQGFFSVQQTCPNCRGKGKMIKDPCGGCHGRGRVEKQKTLCGQRIPNLRLVHLSGAAVSNVDVELYKNYCCPNCILVHRMGVTETGTIRWYFIDKMTSMGGNRVPIGYSADHKEALILDDAGEEISDNRAGEIAIKSRYLSLGYWRKPHLTQTRFLPDPDGGDRRIYLTGDFGRMAPDGCLVHLGRNDYRVKVRGFSVGVGEIESALLEHRGIHDAVVVGWESPWGSVCSWRVTSLRLARRRSFS